MTVEKKRGYYLNVKQIGRSLVNHAEGQKTQIKQAFCKL